jgi:hypothetical protein
VGRPLGCCGNGCGVQMGSYEEGWLQVLQQRLTWMRFPSGFRASNPIGGGNGSSSKNLGVSIEVGREAEPQVT